MGRGEYTENHLYVNNMMQGRVDPSSGVWANDVGLQHVDDCCSNYDLVKKTFTGDCKFVQHHFDNFNNNLFFSDTYDLHVFQ